MLSGKGKLVDTAFNTRQIRSRLGRRICLCITPNISRVSTFPGLECPYMGEHSDITRFTSLSCRLRRLSEMERKQKSNVWIHFDLDREKKKTKCRLCGIHLSYTGSTTSTMRKHLLLNHRSATCEVSNPVNTPRQTTIGNVGQFAVKSRKPADRQCTKKFQKCDVDVCT